MVDDGADRTVYHEEPVVAFDALPAPMLRYSTADGAPTITAVNGAFEDHFPATTTGMTLDEWYDRESLEGETQPIGRLTEAARTHRPAELDVVPGGHDAGSRYRARVIEAPEAARSTGFVHLRELPDPTDTVEVDRIASVISHDLRNPLDVAKARLQAARETGDEEHFEHLETAHDRMERIIQDVLTLARGAGAVSPTSSVAIGENAEAAWSTVDTADAELEIDPDLPVAEADPDRLRRLFENLFRNSVEHGEPDGDGGTGAVTVRVEPTDDGTGFRVADDGPGIPPAERAEVFEPGYSAHENGTGLGLTIVERIAEAHGWRVSLTSSRTGGTCFEFHGLEAHPG